MPKKLSKGHIAFNPSSATSSTTASLPAVFTDGRPLPRLFVFDLDYTLWPLWVDTHVTPPLKAQPASNHTVAVDRLGDKFGFYRDVPSILRALAQIPLSLAVASRTTAPDLARDMLKILHLSADVPPRGIAGVEEGEAPKGTEKEKAPRAIDIFDAGLEMYPGSKIRHMEAIAKRTGIPFTDMLFFDDESRNYEVETLGVTMYLVRDGVTWSEMEKGIQKWRSKKRTNAD